MPRLILPTFTVAILRRASSGNTIGNDAGAVGLRALDCGEIDALQRCVGSAVYDWENGHLDGGAEVHEALKAARETLNAALDEAHEGELDGLAAARDHERAYGDDTPSHDGWQRDDAGEYLGIH